MSDVVTTQDPGSLSITFVSDLPAPPATVWQAWADPRRLERWWGPPTWPATVTTHDLTPGGRAAYYMTGPDGERVHGWWQVLAVDEPRSLELRDGFADGEEAVDPTMPTSLTRVDLQAQDGGTRMTVRSTYVSRQQMEDLVAMGMVEGMEQCLEQLREQLAEGPAATGD